MSDTYEGWAIVELMGHRQRAGKVSEADQYGAKLLRVEIPAGEEFVTEFYGGAAIYCLRPAAEDVARAMAERLGDPRPVAPVAYQLTGPPADRFYGTDDDFEPEDMDDDDENPELPF